jgi:hypothetical protein
MPNRILRDWTDSEPINLLSWQSEVFFTRLIMKVDDFGRFSANPKLLRSLLFPIRDGVRDADISRDLAECEKAGLLAVYEADGKPYLQIEKFGNTPRAKESKYPAPASNLQANACNLQASASKCMHLHANAPVTVTETVTEFVTETDTPTGEDFPESLNTEAFKTEWENYLAYRREAKLKPLKPQSIKAKLSEIALWGEQTAITAIRNSISNGWQGIFYPSSTTPKKPHDHRSEKRSREFSENIHVPDII